MRVFHYIGTILLVLICLSVPGCIGTDLVAEIPEDDGPSSIEISSTATAVEIGQDVQFEAVLYRLDGSIDDTVDFEWISSMPAVAAITAAGTVTALTAGEATITARALGIESDPLTLTVVSDLNQIAVVELTPDDIEFMPGETAQLMAVALNVRGDVLQTGTPTYAIADPSVASVDSNGRVTALAPGITTATATVDGVSSSPAGVRVLGQAFSGTFSPRAGTSYSVSGRAILQEQPNGSFILSLEDDFLSSDGPGLHVFLSSSNGVTATSIDLGDLQSTSGAQDYFVSSSLDPSRYRWVLIHCVPFNVTFGSATLNKS